MRLPILALSLVISCLSVALYFHASKQEEIYHHTAKPYATGALAEISDWRPETLNNYLSDDARASITPNQLAALATQWQPLGRFQSFKEITFGKLVYLLSIGEPKIAYSGVARFSHGDARFTITLKKSGTQFQIYNLSIAPMKS